MDEERVWGDGLLLGSEANGAEFRVGSTGDSHAVRFDHRLAVVQVERPDTRRPRQAVPGQKRAVAKGCLRPNCPKGHLTLHLLTAIR